MKSRFVLCSDCLQEAEETLIELKQAMGDDFEGRAEITQALSLIHAAQGAIAKAVAKLGPMLSGPQRLM
jgi:hypothetical protein